MATAKKSRKKKSKIKKGKMMVPADKIIIFCLVVIIVCVALLFVLTYRVDGKTDEIAASETKTELVAEKTEVSEEKPVVTETKASSKKETETKTTSKTETKSAAKTEKSSSKTEEKKTETAKSTEKKVDVKVTVNNQKTDTNTVAKTETKTSAKPETKTSEKTESKTQTATSQPKTETKTAAKTETTAQTKTTATVTTEKFNFPKAVNNAQLVFLFDDGGQSISNLQEFLSLPFPITVAVLPDLAYSTESARKITASGNELMLHQPMQAQDLSVNPGKGAITPEMSYSQIVQTIKKNLAQLPGVKGMNNHEGSLITSDELKMQAVLDAADQANVFFLDSRTTVDTKVPSVSMSMDRGWYERNGMFLDNKKTREEFLTQLRKNLDIANKTGCVIMIAHIWSADYLPALIKEVYPELKAQGYVFKTVSTSKGKKE